jgi:hypothetical protein
MESEERMVRLLEQILAELQQIRKEIGEAAEQIQSAIATYSL